MDTKDSIVADLQRVASLNETGNVTRTAYREHGSFETFEIEKYFGTFTEAKRAAGINPTRIQSQLLGQVAKHASFDDMRKFNIDRADFGEMYRRNDTKRFQTIMVAVDVHDIEMDPFWRHVFVDSVRRVQPDKIVFGGDLFDLAEFGKYAVDPRTWDVVGRIKAVHDLLGEVREAAPDAELVLIEGNHEYRLLRFLAESAPNIRAVLSDLHGWGIAQLLGLDKYEVRYVARGDLAAWNKGDIKKELGKNYEVFYKSFLVDHFPVGIRRGLSGCNGHHHKFEARSFYSELRGSSMWLQLGAGHRPAAEYCEGAEWNMGFNIVHIDTENYLVNQNYVPVTDFAEVGGKFYHRAG